MPPALTKIKALKDHKLNWKVSLLLRWKKQKVSSLQKTRDLMTMPRLESLSNHLQSKKFLVKELLVKCSK